MKMQAWVRVLAMSALILSAGVIGAIATDFYIWWISIGTWNKELSGSISILVGFAIVFCLTGYIYPPWSERWKRS